jgi:hypothetical protein
MLMRSTKCGVSYTGFLEDRDKKVNLDSRTPQERESINKKPTLLFRGKYNEEAGIDILVKTIALTETDLNFIVVTNISKPHDLTSGNITWYSERISDEKLTNIYNRVDACLGQLGINERTQFTIPHKAFEAAYFGKAYISKESLSLDEVFGEDCYMRIMTSEPESIAREIVKLTHSEIQEFGTNLENRYRSTLCNEIIVDNFLQDVRRLVGNV